MLRVIFAGLFLSLAGSPVFAQGRPIQWMNNLERAFETAKQAHRPLMVYVTGGSSAKDSPADDIESEQQKVFRDPAVVEMAHSKFVPVKISRTSQTTKSLEQLGLPTRYGLYVAFVGTDGKLIQEVPPGGVAKVATILQVMHDVLKAQRVKIYDAELKPVLTDTAKKPAEIRKALAVVKEQEIAEADTVVVELLKRPDLDKEVTKDAEETLAVLSSKTAIDALVEKARAGDVVAGKALQNANPAAAEMMLDYLGDANAQFQFTIYQAVTKIAQVKSTKPQNWWEKAKDNMKKDEIERVRKLVRDYAKKWQESQGTAR
jgi:hypothetical protein